MLTLTILGTEHFDEENERFVSVGDSVLELEHSLSSLYRWESKWQKPFLGDGQKTDEEVVDYVRCMTLTPGVPEEVYSRLSAENVESINDYIQQPMSAAWFQQRKKETKSKETLTADLIYYWLVSLNIPLTCEHWHLNRLFTFIRVFNVKNDDKNNKMNQKDAAQMQRELNEKRKAEYNTSG